MNKQTNKKQTLTYRVQTDGYWKGGEVGEGMDEKGNGSEGGHLFCTSVLFGMVESPYCTVETNITPFVNELEFKEKL